LKWLFGGLAQALRDSQIWVLLTISTTSKNGSIDIGELAIVATVHLFDVLFTSRNRKRSWQCELLPLLPSGLSVTLGSFNICLGVCCK